MSTEINKKLFVLRHLQSQEYVCYHPFQGDFYLYPSPSVALVFDSTNDSITTDVFNKLNWDENHFPSTLEFEVVELLMAPDSIIIRQ
jgi:hypothetical protein